MLTVYPGQEVRDPSLAAHALAQHLKDEHIGWMTSIGQSDLHIPSPTGAYHVRVNRDCLPEVEKAINIFGFLIAERWIRTAGKRDPS